MVQFHPDPPYLYMNKISKKLALRIASVIIAIALFYFGYNGYVYTSTDNAVVKISNTRVASEVAGYIKSINFSDGDTVVEGDKIIEIEKDKYQIQYDDARATHDYYKSEYNRFKALRKQDFVSSSELDKMKFMYETSLQKMKMAEYNLSSTDVVAKISGSIANMNIKIGDYVNPGHQLFSIINKDKVWIEANFKEVDVKDIKVGQEAIIEVDTFGWKKYKAVVKAIMPATGAEFSLLPAQNTSGNWIKVTQRIQVRLEFVDIDTSIFASGMSAYVKIKTV
jgi:membrane fusion protein (multidrug efflux system)